MSYAIFRGEGIKTLQELSQKGSHNERAKEKYKSNPNIRVEDSKNNIEIIKCNKYVDKFYEMTREYQKEHYDRMKNMRADRKKSFHDMVNDSKSVVADEMIFTSDKDFFKNMSKEELMNWANETMNFVYEELGYTKEQILHAIIHMDEKVPHLHCVVVPLVKKFDKRTGTIKYTISKRSYVKDKVHLCELQDKYHERLTKKGFNIQNYAVDSGYLTLDIKKYFIENNIFGVFGYRRYGTKESRKEKSKYKYNKELDVYIEKETGEVLEYNGLIDKLGYKKYQNLDKMKVVRRHLHEEWNENFKENKLSEFGKKLYQRRKEHIERSFADSKQNHGYRYAMYKGIEKNQNYTWLICAAQNMKNIAIKNDNVGRKPLTLSSNIKHFIKIMKYLLIIC